MNQKKYHQTLVTIQELKVFLVLWFGQSISNLGSSMTSYALLLWVYQQQQTATSIGLLAVCTYLPPVLFSFFAGTLVDRWDKKKIMLICDSVAAVATLGIWMLLITGNLRLSHVYIVNIVIGLMQTFQSPASSVVVSVLVPKQHYMRASGLSALSGSLSGILTPAIATAMMAFWGIQSVFLLDLLAFVIAFTTLFLFIRIPHVRKETALSAGQYGKECREGFAFLRKHSVLLRWILLFAAINIAAYLGGAGTLPTAMILARTDQNHTVLGFYSTAVAIGTLLGSAAVTIMHPPVRKVRMVLVCCGISFLLCDLPLACGPVPWIWIAAGFAGNLPLPLVNANMSVIMRTQVPIALQGRVFAARDTLQYCTIPVGYFFSGILADYIFEPWMAAGSTASALFAGLVGYGAGAGMALLLLFMGSIGAVLSFGALADKRYKELDQIQENL